MERVHELVKQSSQQINETLIIIWDMIVTICLFSSSRCYEK